MRRQTVSLLAIDAMLSVWNSVGWDGASDMWVLR